MSQQLGIQDRKEQPVFFTDMTFGPIKVDITRRRQKRISVRPTAAGGLHVQAPLHMDAADIEAFMQGNKDTIHAWIRRSWEPLISGNTRLWGQITSLEELLGHVPETPAQLQEELLPVLEQELRGKLDCALGRAVLATGIEPAYVGIRTMSSRWGSCTPATRRIRVSTWLAAYPPKCLHAILVHELVHIEERGHTKRFWELVRTFDPNYDQAVALLDHVR
ncbi:MAG: DUF45 domain-containing protein [Coriobacteriaceae bacterium]|nr:DUF45 domain-containing protein [Coriobacteriaceae bacterium]